MADRSDPASLFSKLKADDIPRLIDRGIIEGGMIPKVECCLDAMASGVKTTHILDGRELHSILLELLTDKGIGTMVEKLHFDNGKGTHPFRECPRIVAEKRDINGGVV